MSTVKTPDAQANSKVGATVAESNCQKPIAIYPVRYSVAYNEHQGDLDGVTYDASTLTKTFPQLEKSLYTLRSLRPETYVYIYNENTSNKLACFFYSSAVGNTDQARFYWMIKDGEEFIPLKDNPNDCIWVRNETGALPKSIQFGCSDAPISHRVWDELNSNTNLRSKLLPTTVPLQPWIDACKKAKKAYKKAEELDPKTDQVFPVSDLENQVIDFSDDDLEWSEQEKTSINAASIKATMQIVNPEAQLVLAMHDPIGLARELNHITAMQNAKASAYIAEKNHEFTSAQSISAFFKNIDSLDAYNSKLKLEKVRLRNNLEKNKHTPSFPPIPKGRFSPEEEKKKRASQKKQLDAIQQRIDEAYKIGIKRAGEKIKTELKAEKTRMLKHLRGPDPENKINNAITEYFTGLDSITSQIKSMVNDQQVWIDNKKPCYLNIHNALHFYDGYHEKQEWHLDFTYVLNAYSYEENVLHMISSLGLHDEGLKLIEALLLQSPDDSIYWKAIAKGDKNLWGKIKNTLSFSGSILNVLDKSTTWGFDPRSLQTLSQLALVAQPVLMKNATVPVYSGKAFMLRATLVSRLSNTIEPVVHNMPKTIAHEYLLSWETTTNDRKLPEHKRKKPSRANIEKAVRDQINQIKKKGYGGNIEILSWQEVQVGSKKLNVPETVRHTYYNSAKNPFSGMYKFLASDKAGGSVAGAIAFMTVFDVYYNFTDVFSKKEKTQSVIALSSSLTGFTSGILGLTDIVLRNFEYKGNLKFSKSIALKGSARATIAYKAMRLSVIAGAVSGISSSIGDGTKAVGSYSAGDIDSAAWRAGASALNATSAITALGAGAASGLLGAGAKAAITGLVTLGPMGWFALGVLAAGSAIYFSFRANKATDGPEEIWLKRSYWGVIHNHDFITEQATMRSLFYRPTVTADWNDDFLDPDTLEVIIQLPQYQPGKSVLEIIHSVTLEGKALTHGNNASDKQYRFKKELINSGEGYAVYKLSLTLDDDAKANIQLWYYPNKHKHPNLKIEGSAKGRAWVFEDDFWGNTIDSDEFIRIEDK